MTKRRQKETDKAALEILRSTGADVLEAALVAKAAMEAARGKVKRALKCIGAGADALRLQEKTVTFEKAVAAALEARKERRIRTLYDFRYFTRRFMLRCKGLTNRRVRGITHQECAEYIETAFDTPRQRQKARLILSGVFSTAVKRGWCDANPVARVEAPRVVERPVPISAPVERMGQCRWKTASRVAAHSITGSCAFFEKACLLRPRETGNWYRVYILIAP